MPFVRLSTRLLLILILMMSSLIVFSSPDDVQAQGGEELAELVTTENELVSVRVPTGWWFYDNSGDSELPLFSTMLVFGDVENAIYTRIDYNRGNILSNEVVGRGGEIILLDNELYQETFGTAPSVQGLVDILMGSYESSGADILDGPDFIDSLNGQALIIQDGALEALVVVMEMNNSIVLVSMEADQSIFEDNFDLFSDMLFSIASPAEQPEVATDDSGDSGFSGGSLGANLPIEVRSADNRLGVSLPEGWGSYVDPNPEAQGAGINIAIYIGSSQEAADIFAGVQPGTVSGVGGILLVAQDDTQNKSIEQLWDESLSDTDGISPINIETGEINGHPARWGEVADFGPTSDGYWVVIAFPDNQAMVAFILTNDGQWETQRPVVEEIFKSIQYDTNGLPPIDENAEPDNTDVNNNSGGLGGLGGGNNNNTTSGATPELTKTLLNDAGTLEVSVPGNWLTFADPDPGDFAARLVFGSNQDILDTFPNANGGEAGMGGIMILGDFDLGGLTLSEFFDATLTDSELELLPIQTGMINGFDAQWAEYTVGTSSGYWIVYNLGDAVLLMNIRADASIDWSEQSALAESIFKSVRYNTAGLDSGSNSNDGQLGELGQ